MQKYSNNAVDLAGRPINGASILVTNSLGVTATLYGDNGITPLSNPITTSQDGEYAFYAANGRYTVAISAAGFTGESVADILLNDPAEPYPSVPTMASLAASGGSALVGFLGGGAGSVARTVQDKLRDGASISDGGVAAGGTAAANLTAINAAIAAAFKQLGVPAGDFLLTSEPTNTLGIEFDGDGRLMKPITGGNVQLNSYADKHKYVFGREYLSSFHKRVIAGSACSIIMSGDSTTNGDSSTTPYRIWELIPEQARMQGIAKISATNAGHSGATTADWVSTYLATDLAAAPNLYVLRWGVNDPYTGGIGHTIAQFASDLRSGLATLRASKTVADLSVVLMMPNSTSDTPGARDEKWYEQVARVLRRAARDYQCCFVDTYAYLQDSRRAADYMDAPYAETAGSFVVGQQYEILSVGTTDFTLIGASSNTVSRIFTATGVGAGTGTATPGRHIHPLNVMNLWISSLLGEVIFPRGLGQLSANKVRNLGSADGGGVKLVAAATSTYAQGISMHRATPAGDGTTGWPFDGVVVTFNHADNVQLQINYPYVTTTTAYAFRLGQSGVWQTWVTVGLVTGTWTPTIFGQTTAGANTYTNQFGWYSDNAGVITAHFRVTLATKDAAMAGNIVIGGLPFAPPSIGAFFPSVNIARYTGITLTASYTQLAGQAIATGLQLIQNGSGQAGAAVTATELSGTCDIYGTVTYKR